MAGNLSPEQLLTAMVPSDDFRTTVDTTRYTRAVYLAKTADGVAFNVRNEVLGSNIQFYTGGQVLPIRTKTAITCSGYALVYLY